MINEDDCSGHIGTCPTPGRLKEYREWMEKQNEEDK